MGTKFDQLVTIFNISPLSTNVLHQIIFLLQQQTDKSLSPFISQSFQSLLSLKQWSWQIFSENYHEWINQPYYQEFFQTFASFNRNMFYCYENIEVDTKASLLFPETIDQVNSIFQQIEEYHDDNHSYISIVSLWFDNLSYFIHDNPHHNVLSITDHINQYIIYNYVMSEQFKYYLTQLRQPQLSRAIFTAKMLFYIKTCLFSLFSYIAVRVDSFPYTPDEMLRFIGDDYLQIVHVHSRTVASWSKELLTCMAHLISFAARCCWWDGQNRTQTKLLFSKEQMLCDHVQDLIDIIAHKQFQKQIKPVRSNDETILIYATLTILLTIVQTQNINWFISSSKTIQNVLSSLAEISLSDRVCLCVYAILGEVLTDEQLKDLKIVETLNGFFFNALEHAWRHTSKKYKQMEIEYLLRGFLNLSKHDVIQQRTADFNKIPLLIEIADQYPIVYDILWALSFNQNIQQQLHSNAPFISKLHHLAKECDNQQIRKIIHGLLWNLEIYHEHRPTTKIDDNKTFDIMVSYSHKEKELCKQIYDKLIKFGYRVWIDFDQMHGNVMDAMAQAIEQSQTVIICMSEQYRKSNYCRAEAHYAFQRQRKIVPLLLQKHFKPDGWLLFLIGQLVYVDFNKHEFKRAMEMLFKELKIEDIPETNVAPIQPEEDIDSAPSIVFTRSSPRASTAFTFSPNILEWTQTEVHMWLVQNNLIQMSRLLTNCDGRSLVYLSKYMKNCRSQQILDLLQEDSLRRTKKNISLVEISCFLSLMDQQKKQLQSIETNINIEKQD